MGGIVLSGLRRREKSMFADWEIEILKELLPVVRVRMKEIMELGYAVTPLPYLGTT